MRFALLLVLAGCLLGQSPALAQTLQCGADNDGDGTGDLCTHTKYGMSPPADRDFRYPAVPEDTSVWNRSTFEGSFALTRFTDVPGGRDCGPEDAYHPQQGQMILRELDGCVPTSEAPGAEGNGTCDDGVTACINDFDCDGQCNYDLAGIGRDGGCPVEIPQDLLDDFDTPDAGLSNLMSMAKTTSGGGAIVITSATRTEFGATTEAMEIARGSGELVACLPENQLPPSIGFRYNLPEDRRVALGLDPGATFIHWVDDPRQGLRRYSDGGTCCNSAIPGFTCPDIFPTLVQYPALGVDSCAQANQMFFLRRTPDWVFEGGSGTDWKSDREYAPIGQTEGRCLAAPALACDLCDPAQYPGATCSVGPQFSEVGNPCLSVLGDDTNLPSLSVGSGPRVVDGCDMREIGSRSALPANTGPPEWLPIVTECGGSITRLAGFANRFCSILPHYDVPGDPGADCRVHNFATAMFADDDCDGVIDGPDLCPYLNNFDHVADSDGDCSDGDPLTICRGDECECGDQRQDGQLNINDILDQNAVIFGLTLELPICDANNDLVCNINDILEVNRGIFGLGVSSCRHVTRFTCGPLSPTLDNTEECDDGNIQAGDGCSPGCTVEEGWACTEPSGLCQDGVTACTTGDECAGIDACVIDTPSVCGLIP